MSPTFRFIPAMYRAAVVDRVKTQTRRLMNPQPLEGCEPNAGSCVSYCPAIDRGGLLDAGDEVYGIYTEDEGWIATYGPPRTVLPVVTTWAVHAKLDAQKPLKLGWGLLQDHSLTSKPQDGIWWDDGTPKPDWAGKSRPAMFFPKQLYPLARQAKVVSVKAERVQSISAADAIAEGVTASEGWESWAIFTDHSTERQGSSYSRAGDEPVVGSVDMLGNKILAYRRDVIAKPVPATANYARLWDAINVNRGKGDLKGQYAWQRNPWVFATTFEVLPAE